MSNTKKVIKTVTQEVAPTSCFKVSVETEQDKAMIDTFSSESIAYHKLNRNKTILGNDPNEAKKFVGRYNTSIENLTEKCQLRVYNLANKYPIGFSVKRTLRTTKVRTAILSDPTITTETLCVWTLTSLVKTKGFSGCIQKITPYYNAAVHNDKGVFLCYGQVNFETLETLTK